MQKTGKYYRLTIYALCLCVLGVVTVFLCSGVLISRSWGIVVGQSIACFGGGISITTTLISALANADPKDQAIATACTYLFRSLGSVIGVSISATVVQQRLRVLLREELRSGKEADRIVEGVRRSLDFIKGLEPEVASVVRECYQRATSASFGVSIGIVTMALVMTFFIKEKKLNK